MLPVNLLAVPGEGGGNEKLRPPKTTVAPGYGRGDFEHIGELLHCLSPGTGKALQRGLRKRPDGMAAFQIYTRKRYLEKEEEKVT